MTYMEEEELLGFGMQKWPSRRQQDLSKQHFFVVMIMWALAAAAAASAGQQKTLSLRAKKRKQLAVANLYALKLCNGHMLKLNFPQDAHIDSLEGLNANKFLWLVLNVH